MADTTKFISLLLLVFPLFTEATHGGEYFTSVFEDKFYTSKFLPSAGSYMTFGGY